MNYLMSKTFLSVVGGIVVTGAVLNLANKGTFGASIKQIATYITAGYGAGQA